MEIQYVYVKTRAQFGKQCIFDDAGPIIDENIAPNPKLMGDYIYKDPCHTGVQKSKQFALHETQTSSTITKENGMFHAEGGWPKEVNPKDEEVTARFRRRVEKDDNWPPKMKALLEPMEECVLQNNAINIYENFFDDMVPTELVLPLEARTVNVYADPQQRVRPITHLSWSPDQGKRLAVSYCCMEFQSGPSDLNPYSYIWEIENPNKAFMALKAVSPSVVIEFNPRDPSMLISGLMSGQVCNWDIRTGNRPVQFSHPQFSHRNPTNQALWINSKTNSEFFSASTGGQIKWWDIRKLREPTETLVMDLDNPMRADTVEAVGVSSLQFEPTMGTKFMAGMENGTLISGTRKGKNPLEKLALRFNCHYGPVVAIDRNPFSVKQFLTTGDWTARIWAEDTKESNLISTKHHKSLLTGGCWSTSRYSVFYVINMDGLLEVYDLLIRIDEPVRTIRLCEDGLKAITPHEDGKLVAAASIKGNVYLVECSEAFTINAKNDKVLLTNYLERCSRYEKAIDNRLKEGRLAQKVVYENTTEPVPKSKRRDSRSKGDREKGKGKEKGKEKGAKEDKEKEEKDNKGKIDEKDKKKVKSKKTKDGKMLSDDPELIEAEAQYYSVIQKEVEKYTNVKDVYDEEASALTLVPELLPSKRKRHDDPRGDKDGGKKTEKEKGGKSAREKGGKGGKDDHAEKIVTVKRKKKAGSLYEDRAKRLEEEKGEGMEERMKEEEEEKERKERESGRNDRKGRKRRLRGQVNYSRMKMEKPCGATVCEPTVCCKSMKGIEKLDTDKALDVRRTKSKKRATAKPPFGNLLGIRESRSERQSLRGGTEYPVSRKKRIFLEGKNDPPDILDKEVKMAKRQMREEMERIKSRKWGIVRRTREKIYADAAAEEETESVKSESTVKVSTATEDERKESVEGEEASSRQEETTRVEFKSIKGGKGRRRKDSTRCEPEGMQRISVKEVLKRMGDPRALELQDLKEMDKEPVKKKGKEDDAGTSTAVAGKVETITARISSRIVGLHLPVGQEEEEEKQEKEKKKKKKNK